MSSGGANDNMEVDYPNVIRLRVQNGKDLSGGVVECEKIIDRFPWRLEVSRAEDKSIEVLLYCEKSRESKVFEDYVEGEVKLVSPVDDSLSVRKEISEPLSYQCKSPLVYECKFDDVAQDSNFVISGNIVIEAQIVHKLGNGYKFRERFQPDFFCPSKYSDLILSVEGEDLHVSKQILAHASTYYEVLFFGDFKKSAENKIVIEDIPLFEICNALEVVYGTGRGVDCSLSDGDFEYILMIADQYQIPMIMILAEDELIFMFDHISLAENLLYSDRYSLFDLRAHCLSEWYEKWSEMGAEEVMNYESYNHFSSELKDEINEWIIDFEAKNSENVKIKVDILKKSNAGRREMMMPKPDLLTPSRFSDVVLLVEGEKIYASKQILSHASSCFEVLFYDDPETINKKDFVIEDVSPMEFLVALEMIYDTRREVDDANVQFLLKLADRFKITSITDRAEIWLNEKTDLPLHIKLRLAEQYTLEVLMVSCEIEISNCTQICELKHSDSYIHYSNELKIQLFEKMIELSDQGIYDYSDVDDEMSSDF